MIGRVRLALVAVALCVLAGCGSSGSPSTTSSTSQATSSTPAARHVERVSVPKLVGERFGRAVKMVEQAGLRQEAPHFTGTVGNPHYNGTLSTHPESIAAAWNTRTEGIHRPDRLRRLPEGNRPRPLVDDGPGQGQRLVGALGIEPRPAD